MCVLVYHTDKLFWDMEGVSDLKDLASLAWFVLHILLMLLGQELIKILSENTKIMAWEMDMSLRTMSCNIKQDLGLSNDK